MRSDATEAALGLLGLTGTVDFSKPTNTLKRKTTTTTTTNTTNTTNTTLDLGRSFSPPASLSASVSVSSRFPTIQRRDHPSPDPDQASSSNASETIDCVCGFTYDDGFSVLCDFCGTWVHAACFDVVEGRVPEIFKCWKCDEGEGYGRGGLDKLRERAVKVQRAKQRDLGGGGGGVGGHGPSMSSSMSSSSAGGGRRRVSSPSVDRKRKVSVDGKVGAEGKGGVDGHHPHPKRRRRLSLNPTTAIVTRTINQASTQASTQSSTQASTQASTQSSTQWAIIRPSAEDEQIDIEQSYVHTEKDLVAHQHTRNRLEFLAQHWRGVTALDVDTTALDVDNAAVPVYLHPSDIPPSPPTSLYALPSSTDPSSSYTCRPPSYAVRTTQPIPSSAFIAPFTSTIVPSTVYLADPLNSYAHLGMPKPFVHLLGPPLDLALDARLAGNGSRFVRSGCRPNAVLRPVLCSKPKPDSEDDPETLTFGVFALRDLKAQEEVVLGWEWDDGSVIHRLPALIDSPHLFAPARFDQFKHQMASMLHALSSTFTTCACGAAAKDCALNRLAEFVSASGHSTPPSPSATDDLSSTTKPNPTDLGPLVAPHVKRGFRTRERVPMSGGLSGVEMDLGRLQQPGPSTLKVNQPVPLVLERSRSGSTTASRKGKGRATVADWHDPNPRSRTNRVSSSGVSRSASPQPQRQDEDRLPPKLRKRWIHKMSSEVLKDSSEVLKDSSEVLKDSSEVLKDSSRSEGGMDVDQTENTDSKIMPPPPLPRPLHEPLPFHNLVHPRTHEVPLTSPTTSFANLSLLSPSVIGPTPHFPGSFFRPGPPCVSPPVLRENTNMQLQVKEKDQKQDRDEEGAQDANEEKSILGAAMARRENGAMELEAKLETNDDNVPCPPPAAPTVHEPTSVEHDQPQSQVSPAVDPPTPAIEDEPKAGANTPPEVHGSSKLTEDTTTNTPAPLAPTKVKLSLKDFARRRKMRQVATASSPVAPGGTLPAVFAASGDSASASPLVEPSPLRSASPGIRTESEASEPSRLNGGEPACGEPACGEPACAKQSLLVDAASVALSPRSLVHSPLVHSPPQQCASLSPARQSSPVAHSPVHPPASEYRDTPRSPSPTSSDAPVPQIMSDEAVKEQSPQHEDMALDDHPSSSVPGEALKAEADSVLPPAPNTPSATQGGLETKRELISPRVRYARLWEPVERAYTPSRTPSRSRSRSPRTRSPYLSPPPAARNDRYNAYTIPDYPRRAAVQQPLARQISQEDGEILSPPPPKPVPLAPRPRTPPTHPRFHPHSSSVPSRRPPPPPLPPYRPPPVNTASNNISSSTTTTTSSRPLPSAPRALRNMAYPVTPSYTSSSSSRPDAPRGPSADRDRDRHGSDWERDRGRVGSWSRSRGGGNWVR